MAQLRLGYPELRKHNAEVLQVTHSTAAEARLYFRQYPLDFPYLCDPDQRVHERYGVPIAPKGLMESAQLAVASAVAGAADQLLRGEKTPSPVAYLKRYGLRYHPEQAVFVVDREGIIRYVHTADSIGAIPPNAELVRELSKLP